MKQGDPLPTIPLAGKVTIALSTQSDRVFEVHCAGLTEPQQRALADFFVQMGGSHGNFRLEHGPVIYRSCRFDNDTLPREVSGPAPHGLKFAIKVLRA
jgi:hypothetical protein